MYCILVFALIWLCVCFAVAAGRVGRRSLSKYCGWEVFLHCGWEMWLIMDWGFALVFVLMGWSCTLV